MDPTENLRTQKLIANRILRSKGKPDPDDCALLAELVVDLDKWLAKGGFLPEPWMSRN